MPVFKMSLGKTIGAHKVSKSREDVTIQDDTEVKMSYPNISTQKFAQFFKFTKYTFLMSFGVLVSTKETNNLFLLFVTNWKWAKSIQNVM